MKISIALATYNGEKYIEEQLTSIYDQTHLPDEIVISDDNSNDRTIEIINKIKANTKIEHIIIKNQERVGYSINFNRALSRTKGDIIFLCDQDDVWFSNKIAYVKNEFFNNPSAWVVINDAMLTDEHLNEIGQTKIERHLKYDKKLQGYVIGCCSAVKRELLNLSLPVPHKEIGHDNWIIGIADGFKRKHVSNIVLQYYRRHGKNESNIPMNQKQKINVFKSLKIKRENDKKINNLIFENSMLEWLNKTEQNIKNKEAFKKNIEKKIKAIKIRNNIKTNNNKYINIMKMIMFNRYKYFYGKWSLLSDLLS